MGKAPSLRRKVAVGKKDWVSQPEITFASSAGQTQFDLLRASFLNSSEVRLSLLVTAIRPIDQIGSDGLFGLLKSLILLFSYPPRVLRGLKRNDAPRIIV